MTYAERVEQLINELKDNTLADEPVIQEAIRQLIKAHKVLTA